jgi:hypothetical protein
MIVMWMKISALLAMAFLAVFSPALAGELVGGGAPFEVVEIGADACAALATYVPNGEADYQPGVAADGAAVAPADVDGGYRFEPRAIYSFPVKIAPLANQNPKFSPDTSLEVATVTVDPNTGRVTVDGVDVTGADRALAEACAHHLGKSGN